MSEKPSRSAFESKSKNFKEIKLVPAVRESIASLFWLKGESLRDYWSPNFTILCVIAYETIPMAFFAPIFISGETGMFREELEFLDKAGYHLAADGLSMLK